MPLPNYSGADKGAFFAWESAIGYNVALKIARDMDWPQEAAGLSNARKTEIVGVIAAKVKELHAAPA